MTDSTKSKPSTESGTDTRKNNRWFRTGSHRGEIDQLFDLYWGGPERRITGLTVRIIAVNALALLSLLIGILYLGQYQTRLIEAKLEVFETEMYLATAAISEGAVNRDDKGEASISSDEAKRMALRLGATLGSRIMVFDTGGDLIADSDSLEAGGTNVRPLFRVIKEDDTLESVELLKRMGGYIVSFLPDHNKLPLYPGSASKRAEDYKAAAEAMRGRLSISAWRNAEGGILLTAAMPVRADSGVLGAVMLLSEGRDIRTALGDAWFDIIKVFIGTLLITVLLSIYLSGSIARPLKKLATAAENVRKGRLKYTEIPDMSDRHDEIGELSIVLRDMTHALWERMDTIESFAADVAHEIKNPLTSLKSAVETARIVKSKQDREKLLAIIQHDVERLDRLITDISGASRLDAELSREAFVALDLRQLLYDLVDTYRTPLDREQGGRDGGDVVAVKDGIRIVLDFPQDMEIRVVGSAGRLHQVFQNIVANARSFSVPGGAIRISVQVKANHVSVSIEDEGRGIPENKLGAIFERFYSERPQHEDYGRHSGLGLSICKQIISAHKGAIYAENIKDAAGVIKGARFVVVLNML